MSVSFARAVADGLRAHGITVHFAPGWGNRGNGQSSAYSGGIMHHTASGYDMALPGRGIYNLLASGRRDLSGPLCNSAGNEDGSVTIVAAHPANHAGASGGSWARPFPDTRNFNRMVWGHEIVYPGTTPMRDAQYHTAQVLGGVIGGILRRPNPEWIRAHYETSITGKFDPGYAPGKSISMADFRAGIWGALHRNPPAAPAPAQPGGIEDMAMNDTITTRYNNKLSVHDYMAWTDWRITELYNALLAPGTQASRIPGDKNKTNLRDAIMDSTSWTAQTLGHVAAVRAAVAGMEGVSAQEVAEALKPAIASVVEESVTAALGADNQAQADAIVEEISARLAADSGVDA